MQEFQTEVKRGRGRPAKQHLNLTTVPSIIDFTGVEELSKLNIDPKMMETMVSGLKVDELLSHEKGIPCATNIMCIGDPGVGLSLIHI